MSRGRNKNTAPVSVPASEKSISKPEAVAAILSALDGYSNAAAFLGDQSPLIASGTFHRSRLTSQQELLTVTYRESWLAKRIIDMPSEDMTRAWYSLSTSLPEEALHRLYRLEAVHSVKQEITNAIRWARLYGGSIALMVIRGDEDKLDQPLDMDMLLPDCFQGLLVLDRAQGIEPSLELVSDLDDPDFGLPMYYTVNLEMEGMTSVRIHHSRILRFIGRELPHMEMVAENYWGASELEHIWDELQKRSATSANIAQLIFQANTAGFFAVSVDSATGTILDSRKQDLDDSIAFAYVPVNAYVKAWEGILRRSEIIQSAVDAIQKKYHNRRTYGYHKRDPRS